jgi:hypothetical protein
MCQEILGLEPGSSISSLPTIHAQPVIILEIYMHTFLNPNYTYETQEDKQDCAHVRSSSSSTNHRIDRINIKSQ